MKKKIKILYIYPNLNIGGAQKVVLDLINNIDHENFDVYLACNGGNFIEDVNANVKYRKIKFDNKKYFIKSILEIRDIIKEEHIDIIHSHHRYTTALANIAIKRTKVKLVHSEHNVFPDKNFVNFRGENIIAVSESVKKNLVKNGVNKKDITVIYNGIDKNLYTNVKKIDLKKELNIKGFTFGFIGRLNKQKGIIYMLKAFNNIIKSGIECNLVLIGDGELRKEIENYVSENSLNDRVFILGFRKDIRKIISSLDMYILPSIFEGFPMTNMEIMINKKSLIATDVGGNKEIILDGLNGFIIKPRDVGALEKKIKYILNNKEIIEKLNINSKETIMKNFTMNNMMNRHVNYYYKLIKD